MSKGSYVTLVGQMRMTGPAEKLLRGLLCDDASERWTLEDAKGWSWGSARGLRHKPTAVRARQPLIIGGEDIFYDRMAALKIATLGDAASGFLKQGTLVNWIRRSLGDEARADFVSEAISYAESADSVESDLLVTRICQVLDPDGPVRYHGLAICHDGFGAAVAAAMDGGNLALQSTLTDLFKTNHLARSGKTSYLARWEETQNKSEVKAGRNSKHAKLADWVESGAPGFGLERCLYELNEATPCLSPLIITYGAQDLDSVLQSINAAIVNAGDSADIIDRHVAAFMAAQSDRAAKLVSTLSKPARDPAERSLTILGLFGAMQAASESGALINLAQRMEGRLSAILESFNSSTRRKALLDRARQYAAVGDLAGMYRIVGDRNARRQDQEECQKAAAEYAALNRQTKSLENGSRNITDEIRVTGYKLSTVLGGLVLAGSLWFAF